MVDDYLTCGFSVWGLVFRGSGYTLILHSMSKLQGG